VLHRRPASLTFWVGGTVLGREVRRDRDAEFAATGPVAPLVTRIATTKQKLREDLAGVAGRAKLLGRVRAEYIGTPIGGSAGGALLHVLEELCQHHGQLELTRDVLLADAYS
jgi:hypothetical protein